MRIKCLYRKNLKMSPDKVASQVAHAVIGLGGAKIDSTIIVLGVSDEKFNGYFLNFDCYVHEDLGYTEVESGTKTCLAYFEER